LDLDLGVHLLISFLFFLSYLSIAFVALVGFERERFEHFVCSCHCIWCIGLSSSWRFSKWKFVSLLLLDSWNPRRTTTNVLTSDLFFMTLEKSVIK
jgi:hypothetical protein